MKEKFAIACKTNKQFNAGYYSPDKQIVDTEPYHFDVKVSAEAAMIDAKRIFKERGYDMTLEVVRQILPD